VPGVRLGRYCPQIRGKHCMDRRYEKKWVNSRAVLAWAPRRCFRYNMRQW
jgi:hypothetical protein